MTYQATSVRTSWQRTARCDDISVTYDWMVESGSVRLCQAMREAGKPDGNMNFVADDTSSIYIPSIYQWADHQPTYRGTFYRPRDTANYPWQQCGDIRVEPAYYENGVVKLCRAMRNAGKDDGDMLLVDIGRKGNLIYVASIHRYADYLLISQADAAALREKNSPVVAADPVAKPAKPIGTKRISDEWYRLLLAVKAGDTASWETAHHLTKTALQTYGYVEGGLVTEAGEKALEGYGKPQTYGDMALADLSEIATTIGLHVNGNASYLADTLTAIDTAISARSLNDVEKMAVRLGVPVKYGKGKKGEPLKKRINLVAIVNAGHAI